MKTYSFLEMTERAGARTSVRLAGSGFSLIEMLVVIGIIAIILGLALPNLRGLREGHEMEAASRQLISDLSLARARAINHRTTVAVVFIPNSITNFPLGGYTDPTEKQQILKLKGGVFTQYALFSFRRVGDQPGSRSPRYQTEWKTLPEKTFIAARKFTAANDVGLPAFNKEYFPFPFAGSANARLPYVAFNYEGRLCKADGTLLTSAGDNMIPLTRGAILYSRDDKTGDVIGLSVNETPPGNWTNNPNYVVIDWLTGRARLQRPEIVNATP